MALYFERCFTFATMLIAVLAFGLIGYGIIFFFVARGFRARSASSRFSSRWAATVAVTAIWCFFLFAIQGRAIMQLLGAMVSEPNEDFWAIKFTNFVGLLILAAPVPVLLGCIACSFRRSLWTRTATRVALASSLTLIIGIHSLLHGTCLIEIRDQFDLPVRRALVTYLSDGWTTRETDENGQLKVGYYKGLQGLDIADINAGGYQVDYRLSSHKPFEPIPSKVTLPAWKILRAPQLLLSEPNPQVKTDGTSYFVNLLKESVEATSGSIYDLEVHVHAPAEAQPYKKVFPWSIEINVRDGGLLAASAQYNYLAPEEGYQSTYREAHDPRDNDWKPGFSKLFYLKLRNGRVFAVSEITLTTFSEERRCLFIDANINPAADRNLFWGYGNSLSRSMTPTSPWLRALFGDNY